MRGSHWLPPGGDWWNLLGWLRLCIGRDVDWSGGIATRAEVEAVYRSHGGLVWRAVLTMSAGDRDVADEATSEAFARLLRHKREVRDPVAWVFRTAFRLARKELSRKRVVVAGVVPEREVLDRSALPSSLVADLRLLSADQRVAVFLHYFADLPVGEVARLTGSPVATVKVRLHRGRRALRKSLVALGGEYV
jgi:RNA polymerase sigma-70 factor (ECF subfamily)